MISRLTNRYKRRAISAPNFAFYAWKFAANAVPTYHAMRMRMRRDGRRHQDTIAVLREQGIVMADTDRFLTEGGRAALADASSGILATANSDRVRRIIAGNDANEGKKDFLINLVKYGKGVPPDEPLLKVALDRQLLEIVAAYLEMWPTLFSIGAWLNYPTDQPPAVSQLWHRDPEDLRLIKVFIYLSDVEQHSGPFSYIPRTQPFGAAVEEARRCGKAPRLSDAEVGKVFPPSTWKVCTGGAGSMILADTVGYHSGGKPTSGVRILATFTYTSATPMMTRKVQVPEMPSWASLPIQRFAIRT
jgi:hypothetical protein